MIHLSKRINWFRIRLAIYVLVFIGAIIAPFMNPDDAGATLAVILEPMSVSAIAVGIAMYLVFLGIVCGTLLLLFQVQVRLVGESKRWAVPNHHANPLNWNEPLDFWHFGGWLALCASCGCFAAGLWADGFWLIIGFMMSGIGIAILMSIHLCVRLNRQRFADN